MTTVIEELNDGVLNRGDVQRRVRNWALRIDDLYDAITSWLPADYRVDRTQTVRMHEDMQKQFEVKAVTLPVMNIFRDEKRVAKLVPRGLWIIGANGRLDLHGDGHFIIVDRAENFGSPTWRIAPANERRNESAFDRETLLRALTS